MQCAEYHYGLQRSRLRWQLIEARVLLQIWCTIVIARVDLTLRFMIITITIEMSADNIL